MSGRRDLDDALELYCETDGRALLSRLGMDDVARALDALRQAPSPYTTAAGVWLPAKVWLVGALNPSGR